MAVSYGGLRCLCFGNRSVWMDFVFVLCVAALCPHCKLGQVEPADIECGNGAAAMQISSIDSLALPQHRSYTAQKI